MVCGLRGFVSALAALVTLGALFRVFNGLFFSGVHCLIPSSGGIADRAHWPRVRGIGDYALPGHSGANAVDIRADAIVQFALRHITAGDRFYAASIHHTL